MKLSRGKLPGGSGGSQLRSSELTWGRQGWNNCSIPQLRQGIYRTDPSLFTLWVLELDSKERLFIFQEILGGGIPAISMITLTLYNITNIYFKYYKETEMSNSLSFTGNLNLLILFSRVTIYYWRQRVQRAGKCRYKILIIVITSPHCASKLKFCPFIVSLLLQCCST